jgi:hypothetical protein
VQQLKKSQAATYTIEIELATTKGQKKRLAQLVQDFRALLFKDKSQSSSEPQGWLGYRAGAAGQGPGEKKKRGREKERKGEKE